IGVPLPREDPAPTTVTGTRRSSRWPFWVGTGHPIQPRRPWPRTLWTSPYGIPGMISWGARGRCPSQVVRRTDRPAVSRGRMHRSFGRQETVFPRSLRTRPRPAWVRTLHCQARTFSSAKSGRLPDTCLRGEDVTQGNPKAAGEGEPPNLTLTGLASPRRADRAPGLLALPVGLSHPSHCLHWFGRPVLRMDRYCNHLNRERTLFPSVGSRVERWRGGLGVAYRSGPFVGRGFTSSTMPRFHLPLIEPDRRVSRIRLSDKDSCLRPREGARPRA